MYKITLTIIKTSVLCKAFVCELSYLLSLSWVNTH